MLVLECLVSTPVPHHMCWTYLTTEKRLALRCQRSSFAVAAVNMSVSVNRLMKGEIWIPLPLISDFKAFASSFHGWMDDRWMGGNDRQKKSVGGGNAPNPPKKKHRRRRRQIKSDGSFNNVSEYSPILLYTSRIYWKESPKNRLISQPVHTLTNNLNVAE